MDMRGGLRVAGQLIDRALADKSARTHTHRLAREGPEEMRCLWHRLLVVLLGHPIREAKCSDAPANLQAESLNNARNVARAARGLQ